MDRALTYPMELLLSIRALTLQSAPQAWLVMSSTPHVYHLLKSIKIFVGLL
jgi:hypothetical protein